MYSAGDVIYLSTTYPTDNIKFQACNVHHNSGPFGIVRSTNYNGGKTDIVKNMIAYNKIGAPIWGTYNNLLIEDNDIMKNDALLDNSPIKLSVGHAIVRGNRVYSNTCQHLAAVGCRSGSVLIEDNLICNNSQYDGGCGFLGGGGGIHLAYNENPAAESFDSTYYIVRNNVIANNYSGWGGGGIYVYNTRATISNNHVVNNTSPMGNAMLINSALSQVYAKSNLFYGISPGGIKDSLGIIYVQSADTIRFDYNYIPAIYSNSVLSLSAYGLGDVSHNVIGTNPQMTNPTANNSVGTAAISKDFSILGTSPCVDKGDTTGAYPALFDYVGSARIENNIVDIGAFEYSVSMFAREFSGIEEMDSFEMSVYPNPVQSGQEITIYPACQYTVYDIRGKIIFTGSEQKVTLSVALGVYFVHSEFGTKKLIVK